ncbi:MAG: hypothetical protein ACJ72V_05345, partial [Nitrososphaeraceae archaeon]
GLNAITREAWTTAQQTEDRRERIQALSLAKECYSMKLELLTNATVVDDAIRFVSHKSKDDLKSSANSSKGCGSEIYFDANSKSQSGKFIPLDKYTGLPHQCQ